jgi:phage-related protein (TIGR01555 family)
MRKTLKKPSYRPLNISNYLFEDDSIDGIIDWREKLKPAETLGKPDKDAQMANDEACAYAWGLLSHSLELGQMPTTASFLGYPALQDIAQNGLIRACIETVADDMTRDFGKIKSEEPDKAEIVVAMNNALEQFHIRDVLHEVAEKVGYFGGCLVYIDTGANDAELQTPLNMGEYSNELRNLKAFRVIDPINVYPGAYNSVEPLKADFFRPEHWYVMGKRVHASRLIRFVANEVPQLLKPVYNFFGIAQAQLLWDYVMHFSECRVATANIAKKYSMTVFKTNMSATLMDGAGTDQINNRIRLIARYQDNNSITAIDKENEDIVKIETPIGGLTDITKQGLEFLAALNRTPAVKLLGISPSGFNATGESDLRNYNDHISSQQEKVFGHGLKTIIDCIHVFLFGKTNKGLIFEWAELGEEDQAAMANTQKVKADTMAVLLDRSVISPEEARQAVASDPDNPLSFIDPADVPEGEPVDFGDLDDADKAGEIY